MGKILKPLETCGRTGINMMTADGQKHRTHPLFATFIGDYPEQVLTTCIYTGECPQCPTGRNSLGDHDPNVPPGLRDLDVILQALDSFDDDPAGFLQTCSSAGVKPVVAPFWKDLPYVNIYQSITPDILHQLFQGVIKHLVNWLISAFGAAEIDACC